MNPNNLDIGVNSVSSMALAPVDALEQLPVHCDSLLSAKFLRRSSKNIFLDTYEILKQILSIFLNISKAFDCEHYEILLHQLESCGLCDRDQCAQVANALLEKNRMPYGVPQGSILGPALACCQQVCLKLNEVGLAASAYCLQVCLEINQVGLAARAYCQQRLLSAGLSRDKSRRPGARAYCQQVCLKLNEVGLLRAPIVIRAYCQQVCLKLNEVGLAASAYCLQVCLEINQDGLAARAYCQQVCLKLNEVGLAASAYCLQVCLKLNEVGLAASAYCLQVCLEINQDGLAARAYCQQVCLKLNEVGLAASAYCLQVSFEIIQAGLAVSIKPPGVRPVLSRCVSRSIKLALAARACDQQVCLKLNQAGLSVLRYSVTLSAFLSRLGTNNTRQGRCRQQIVIHQALPPPARHRHHPYPTNQPAPLLSSVPPTDIC
ncbi:hypothetical protein J6590_046253 [Homalodisca vitripennis]|nr:hypothetical protein J6590_046253 [Homalodisca vitripennis]